MKKFLTHGFLLACILLLTSCSVFSPVKLEATNQYELKTIPHVPLARKTGATLLVTQPITSSIFNTTLIAYTNRPYQISYFSKNQWIATPSEMLQTLLIQTLQNTHAFHAVTQTVANDSYGYLLTTQLIQLIQDFSYNPSVVRLTMDATLIKANTNHIIASKRFSIVEPALENTPYGGVVAANHASARLLEEVTLFCLRSI